MSSIVRNILQIIGMSRHMPGPVQDASVLWALFDGGFKIIALILLPIIIIGTILLTLKAMWFALLWTFDFFALHWMITTGIILVISYCSYKISTAELI
jgi:hypothetical protein